MYSSANNICIDSGVQNYELERLCSSWFVDPELNGLGSKESDEVYYSSIKHRFLD